MKKREEKPAIKDQEQVEVYCPVAKFYTDCGECPHLGKHLKTDCRCCIPVEAKP